jgi:2-polyprenyl-3-methyl-5-hydroxy-6-metoxy-1,4-benzoquinol methylase
MRKSLSVGTFGRYHALTSDALQSLGGLGRLYNRVIGFADVPSYGRFLWFRRALRLLPTPPTRVMDAGSGTGAFAVWMAEQFPDAQITGIELDATRVQKSERVRAHSGLRNLRFQQGDLTRLDSVEAFDFIYSIDVFEHIRDNRDVIRRCRDALSPGGHLLIRIPAERQDRILPRAWFKRLHEWSEVEHVGQHFDLPQLSAALRDCGFDIVDEARTSGVAGRLAFELSFLLNEYVKPVYAAIVPLLKGLYWMDVWSGAKQKGNGIVVLARRPQTRDAE